jgi:L-amino acid N-acyltransferase YncA
MIVPSAREPYRHAYTRTGSLATLRPFEDRDADAIERLLNGLSPTSAYRRFLGSSTNAATRYVSRLRSAVDSLAATVALEDGAVVGVASLHPDREGAAEVAMAVADRDHGDGIGTLLLEDLVDRARHLGLTRLTATVLAENAEMLTVFRDLGLIATFGRPDAGVMDVVLDLAPSDTYDRRVAEPTTLACAASVRRSVRPRSTSPVPDHPGRSADVGAALAVWARTANLDARPGVLVVGDAASARDVREACADHGVLSANLTQQAEQRLRLTVPSVVVDDNALMWTSVTSSDIRATLDTVVDCPTVGVVIVALDQPRSEADRTRCRQLRDEGSRMEGPAVIVACQPGGSITGSLPTFSTADVCAAALSVARGIGM